MSQQGLICILQSKMSETGQSSEGGGAGGFKMENVVNQCLEVDI